MIFSPKIYPRPVAEMILDGTKCCTRRLVKEGQWSNGLMSLNNSSVLDGNKIKWQVGRDYSVQLKRGGCGLWYCPECGVQQTEKEMEECWGSALYKKVIANQNKILSEGYECPYCKAGMNGTFKPLRIKLTGIRKERLLDISLKDIKKEGFKNKDEYWKAFNSVCKPKAGGLYVNPDVWVLDFEVKK